MRCFLVAGAAAAALLAAPAVGQAIPDASAATVAGAQAPGSTAAPEPVFAPDIEPAQCNLGYNCSNEKAMPLYRGICVQATNPGSGNACWDVCNPNHLARAYNVSTREKNNEVLNAGVRSMIQAARAGLNPIITCPGKFGGDPCPLGDTCPSAFLSQFNVPEGRSMCVIDELGAMDRSCWDICDYRHSVSDFTMGTPMGTEDKIYQARASSTCPGLQWWQIFLIVVFFLLVCICLGGVGYIAKTKLSGKKTRTASNGGRPYEAEPRDFKEDCPDMQEGDDEEGSAYGHEVHSREMAPPPSPPRGVNSRDVLLGESYGPPPEEPPRGYFADSPPAPSRDMSMPNPPQYTQSHPQQQQQQQQPDLLSYGQPHLQEPIQQEPPFNPAMMTPSLGATTGVKIPGLDEPNLLGQLGSNLHMTGSAFQTQVPHSPFMAGIVPQNTQPGQTSFNFAPGQQSAIPVQGVMPSFHTQLPSMYQGVASPPSSVQLHPGGGSQQFFR